MNNKRIFLSINEHNLRYETFEIINSHNFLHDFITKNYEINKCIDQKEFSKPYITIFLMQNNDLLTLLSVHLFLYTKYYSKMNEYMYIQNLSCKFGQICFTYHRTSYLLIVTI